MNRKEIIELTEAFVREIVKDFDGAHDWWHIIRVRKMALLINEKEAIADTFILEIAALLHDAADSKFKGSDTEMAYNAICDFMITHGMEEIKDQVIEVVRNVSFSNKKPEGNLKDPVLMILQDADRLDAIGAIGIARVFNHGGFRNNPIYIPGEVSLIKNQSSIAHIYDKLLKLKDLMNTSTAKFLAEEKHAFLLKYLEQFHKEWDFSSNIS
jgi:uncharacterized protein